MRKTLKTLTVLLSLLFNIQIGFTHDIEHQYHEDEHHENSFECEDCRLQDHSTKTTNFTSTNTDFYFNPSFQFNDSYFLRDAFAPNLVAYQPRAP